MRGHLSVSETYPPIPDRLVIDETAGIHIGNGNGVASPDHSP